MYHCEFNNTELVRRKVNGNVAIKNKLFTRQEVKWLFPEALVSVTQDDWQNCCAHLERIEGEACERVNIVDIDIDPVVFTVGNTSSSSDESSQDLSGIEELV
ncbi:hypothetical protein HPB47_014656 [Ixodes persulcatus]|uniref:Uncharacterized protein n=1 Tax=Ixodes persulcatus TaxID=34615 RepID=A0AC60QVG6_IXOPE|nr:hypothetical protein HPB47_014656 [Ixodes persulcatus]